MSKTCPIRNLIQSDKSRHTLNVDLQVRLQQALQNLITNPYTGMEESCFIWHFVGDSESFWTPGCWPAIVDSTAKPTLQESSQICQPGICCQGWGSTHPCPGRFQPEEPQSQQLSEVSLSDCLFELFCLPAHSFFWPWSTHQMQDLRSMATTLLPKICTASGLGKVSLISRYNLRTRCCTEPILAKCHFKH